MKYHFQIHKEKKGFWAESIELKGCVTQADDLAELHRNMSEVLNLYLDEPSDSRAVMPLPRKTVKGRSIVKIDVDPQIAFAFYLRRLRLLNKLTQKEAAKLLGIKNLFSYQRLESSKTANPALSTLVSLKKAFPLLEIDQILN